MTPKTIPERVQKLEDLACQNTDEHKQIMEMLKPISETYRTVNILGKWLTAFLVFVSIIIGIIASWSKIVITFFKK